MPRIPVRPPIFESPIAIDGERSALPISTTIKGKMSITEGFPIECSLEIADGGKAPSRTDMNEALYLISTWAFYAQSGGTATYSDKLNYIKPAIIFHNDILYTCEKANGPDTAGAGVRTPGVAGSETYWIPGLGSITSNQYGNNANNYVKTGIYWVDDASATFNFPTAGVGGFLTVNAKGNTIDHAMVLRTDATKLYRRVSTNNATSYSAWVKALFTNDVRGAAYREIYMSSSQPIDTVGLDGDVHFQYI